MIKKTYPIYSEKYISPFLKFMGLKRYCIGITYPWMSFFYFLCLKKEKKETILSKKSLEKLCKIIVRDKEVYECYEGLKIYKTLLYTSEHPFAWASSFGVLLFK